MKDRIINKIKSFRKKHIILLLAAALLTIVFIGTVIVAYFGKKETVKYRETEVTRGNLMVGVTQSGSVDIGTITQTFDLDMSALTKVSTSNTTTQTSGNLGGLSFNGGMDIVNPFNQIFNMASGSNQTTGESSSQLIVSEIKVSVGQAVKEGDVLYKLEEEGVTELSKKLKSNVEKAEADLTALKADQEISRLSAQSNYDSSVAYEKYAATEKKYSVDSLENTLNSSSSGLESAKRLADQYKQSLDQAKADLEAAQKNYEGAVSNRDSHDKRNDTAMYVYYAQQAENAKKMIETMKQSVEQYESKLEQAQSTVTNYQNQVSRASRQLELGKISAAETYELRVLAYENAQETYDIALAYLEDDLKKQQEIYDEAYEKWKTFVSYIDGVNIKSRYNGVITSVDLNEGDSVATKAAVVTLYDTDDVSMTVTMDEKKMSDIQLGTEANVSLTAYPEEIFKAVVTDIADAVTDSSGNTTQDVTITFSADVSGIYHGMTGEITFLTRELSDVLYVSNRAITRKGTKSYVTVKDASGNINTVLVQTGFSDGVNVEIKEGLSEGDVVLIESKVSE